MYEDVSLIRFALAPVKSADAASLNYVQRINYFPTAPDTTAQKL